MPKSALRGNVRRVDTFLISGWAIDTNDPFAQPAVEIIQGKRAVITLRPQFPAVRLRDALDLPKSPAPPLHSFRLWLPLSNGIKPEVPFSLVFQGTGAPLANGQDRKLSVIEELDREAWRELQTELFFVPSYRWDGSALKCNAKVSHVDGLQDLGLLVGTSKTRDAREIQQDPGVFGRKSYTYSFTISDADFVDSAGAPLSVRPDFSPVPPAGSRQAFHQSLLRLDVPRSVFDFSRLRAPLPPVENIVRVSGRKSDQINYLISGLTTFNKLDAITKHFTGVPITQQGVVVDWGVGCGRVLRHFFEHGSGERSQRQTLIGVDIDEMNVQWCQDNLASLSPDLRFDLLPLDGFRLPAGSVDLLYGISVFTHLSERNQHEWLAEIRRVLKPGAIAVLTVSGEAKCCRQGDEIGLPFVQKFGFFDGVPDSAIGATRSDYYRSTIHSRPYLLKNWGRYFEILDVVPMANFQQDFVVVRRPN